MKYLAFGLAALLVAACGGRDLATSSGPYGTEIAVQSDAPYLHDANFLPAVARAIELTAAEFGRSPFDLAGITLVFVDGPVQCGSVNTFGCYFSDERLVALSVERTWCVGQTALVHELTHFLTGDYGHSGETWTVQLPRAFDRAYEETCTTTRPTTPTTHIWGPR